MVTALGAMGGPPLLRPSESMRRSAYTALRYTIESWTIGPKQVWPKPVDVKAIRTRVKMSQAAFSRAYGTSKRALQEWEQGGRQPDSAARAYLTVIAKEPALVRRVLAGE